MLAVHHSWSVRGYQAPLAHAPLKSLFELTLDALPDGVLLTDRDRHVIYANPAFAQIWNIPDALMDAGDETAMLAHVGSMLIDPQAFFTEVERVHPTAETLTDELRFVDGRMISRRSVPFLDHHQFAARIWVFTDVTEARSARHDMLTGVKNRRAFNDEFPGFVRCAAPGAWKSVALIDVDNFKKYNDHYGHAAGDQVLRSMGEILRKHLSRADDLLFRIGGEEFLVARYCCDEMEIGEFFERVRLSIEELDIAHHGNAPYGKVTASFGIHLFCGAQEPERVFDLADKALYTAKAAGRNRVAFDLLASQLSPAIQTCGRPS
ncbi:diguanylate cyclase [Novosphingobium sp. PS1R-30]|uniref:diguanylate cyclase n=1 Tax=Novosphingobium anseongense TaxID=3133436 RepID=A0ABU8S2U7_9SPHN